MSDRTPTPEIEAAASSPPSTASTASETTSNGLASPLLPDPAPSIPSAVASASTDRTPTLEIEAAASSPPSTASETTSNGLASPLLPDLTPFIPSAVASASVKDHHLPVPDSSFPNSVLEHEEGMDSLEDTARFVERIMKLAPGTVDLTPALAPSLAKETALRRLFAVQPDNPRLADPYIGLISMFDAPVFLRDTRNRLPENSVRLEKYAFSTLFALGPSTPAEEETFEVLFGKHLFAVSPDRRRDDGAPSTVQTMDDFISNWNTFTSGFLTGIDWTNVVAAGGSVLACLQSDSQGANAESFHEYPIYKRSDVDLFLWGLDEDKAKVKMDQIFQSIKAAIRWDMLCIRKRNVVTIYSMFPYRPLQIVLRLYHSPSEILAGFDIDCACVAFDGRKVWANPRAIVALMRQANTVDITRRSPSYEVRLAKYAERGYEVLVPSLDRSRINASLNDHRLAAFPNGLARLLVLERIKGTDGTHYRRLQSPEQTVVGKKNPPGHSATVSALETCGYDSAIVYIPYGPGWNARRIRELFEQINRTIEAVHTSNESDEDEDFESNIYVDERPHYHSMFIANTMQECFEDMCKYGECPAPEDPLLAEKYIRGPLRFITVNPGRQLLSGSFNPIDDKDWEAEAYQY